MTRYGYGTASPIFCPSTVIVSRAAFDRIAELDAVMSDYRDDSELNRLTSSTPGTL